MSEPFRKLCQRLDKGQAPDALSAGGQLRSMYPAPTDSFRSACDFRAVMTRPQTVSLLDECPAPGSMVFSPSGSWLSAMTTKR